MGYQLLRRTEISQYPGLIPVRQKIKLKDRHELLPDRKQARKQETVFQLKLKPGKKSIYAFKHTTFINYQFISKKSNHSDSRNPLDNAMRRAIYMDCAYYISLIKFVTVSVIAV